MKQILTLLLLLCSTIAFAQDVIVKKDGSTVVCRVVELNETEIVYKRWTDLNGSNYVMDRSLASAINYENGKKINLSELTENMYQPSNQNDGYRQINDNALLNIDYVASNPLKKAKALKLTGLYGGGLLFLGGGLMMAGLIVEHGLDPSKNLFIAGISCMSVGAIGGTICLISAHNIKKKVNQLQEYSIYQQEFKFNNGSVLTPSIDLLRDQVLNTQTIGIGMKYNF